MEKNVRIVVGHVQMTWKPAWQGKERLTSNLKNGQGGHYPNQEMTLLNRLIMNFETGRPGALHAF